MSKAGVSLTVVLVLAAPAIAAGSVQDFDSSGSAYALGQHGGVPAANILAGGPSGNFLRLASGSAGSGSTNTIAFDRTDPGASSTIEIEFDFRIVPGAGSADGLGVALLNTSIYGAAGVSAAAEEPDFTASLGIGFDVYQNSGELNDNHVSVHFDGSKVSEVDASSVVDLDGSGGQFIHARIVIDSDATSGSVSVILTAPGGSPVTLIDALDVPNLRPYEGRVQFGARTGGETADHDLDNIDVVQSGSPGVVGTWGNVLSLPVVAIHADLLATGKVLMWDRDDASSGPDTPHLFDPDTESITAAADPGYDLFCAGHSYLPDGRLFVSGGHDGQDGFGLPYGTIYDPGDDTWETVVDEMNDGRWYPTNTTLANGDTLVITGTYQPGSVNQLPEVFEVATNTWRDLNTAVLNVPLYSFAHLAPNGKVFVSGPSSTTRYLDTSGSGSWSTVDSTGGGGRSYGSSVMYDVGKVLIVGGGDPPTRTAEIIDLEAQNPGWGFVDSMAFVRRQLNATILADGTVLVTGGTGSAGFNVVDDAVFAAELWDPAEESWSTLAAAQIPRIYHSFALLLPDGRVLTGGGGHPPGDGPPGDLDHFDAEIFSPPYLFAGSRPQIDSAPATISYDSTFVVESPDSSDIAAIHLIRLSAVTHSFNQNQGISRLSFVTTPGGLEVTAPADGALAQPGPYMLFILNNAGVPSVARMVQLLTNSGSVPDGAGVPGAQLTVVLQSGEVTLDWDPSCAADDIDYAIYEGTIGNFAGHSDRMCTTNGATSATFAPGSGSSYYLVVPRNTAAEGSYGRDSDNLERSPAAAACLPQSLGGCQ